MTYPRLTLARAAIIALAAWTAGSASPGDASPGVSFRPVPRHRATHVLTKGALVAEVMDPHDPERYNRGVRFSPVANVLTATLHGRSFLYSAVEHNPLRQNGGLAMEFDLDTPGGPPGFAEAAIGEGYVKVGVGVLRKAEERYRFGSPQEVIALADTEVSWAEDRAVFRQTCAGVNGYAYALDATVVVEPERIAVSFRLTNTGRKAFATDQYAHNYFDFGGTPVGPGYELEFPDAFQVTGLTDGQVQADRALRFTQPLLKPVNLAISGNGSARGIVDVRCTPTAQRIVASVSRPVAYTRIHATPRYVCPEQFVRISLAPGESADWTREYRFFAAAPPPPSRHEPPSPDRSPVIARYIRFRVNPEAS